MSRTPPCFIFALALCISVSSFVRVAAQRESEIRIDSKLVVVPVSVIDRQGRYITEIRKEEFRIFEEGVEQEVVHFEAVEEPFTAFLLLDRSGSMSGRHREELTDAANVFVRQLRPVDQLLAATFADTVVTVIEPTRVADLKKSVAIGSVTSDTTTIIFDSVDTAFKKLKKIRGRKALIIFSDGVGDGRFVTPKENLEDAEEQEVVIYTIQFDTSATVAAQFKTKRFYEGMAVARKYMSELARLSGGRHFQISEIADLAATFRSIAEELRQQYSLGYYPKTEGNKGERRRIKVTVNRPDVAIRFRTSYLIEK